MPGAKSAPQHIGNFTKFPVGWACASKLLISFDHTFSASYQFRPFSRPFCRIFLVKTDSKLVVAILKGVPWQEGWHSTR
jgi:hypothetical protein